MATIVAIATITGIVAVGSFVGTSISNYLFRDSKEEKTNNELKNEIHVMSSDIKGISTLEVAIISLITAVVTLIVLIACAAFIFKKCKKSREAQDTFSLSKAPGAAQERGVIRIA